MISIVMIAALLIPATLAIAVLVPSDQINITAGIIQAMQTAVDDVWDVGWLVPLLALAIYIDSIGEIAAGWQAPRWRWRPRGATATSRGASPKEAPGEWQSPCWSRRP